jgi:hypothetical protein
MKPENNTPKNTKSKGPLTRGLVTGAAGVLGIWFLISSLRIMLDTEHLPSLGAKLTEAGIFFSVGVFFIWLRFKRLGDDLK